MEIGHHITNGRDVKIIVCVEAHVDHDEEVAVVPHDFQHPDFISHYNSTMTGSTSWFSSQDLIVPPICNTLSTRFPKYLFNRGKDPHIFVVPTSEIAPWIQVEPEMLA